MLVPCVIRWAECIIRHVVLRFGDGDTAVVGHTAHAAVTTAPRPRLADVLRPWPCLGGASGFAVQLAVGRQHVVDRGRRENPTHGVWRRGGGSAGVNGGARAFCENLPTS